jgi:hypothetical protein
MLRKTTRLFALTASLLVMCTQGYGQEVAAKNAQNWSLSGRAQFQHFHNYNADNANKTTDGFRIRRGRFAVSANLTEWVSSFFQIEVRDNAPSLKDAFGRIKIGSHWYAQFGQFKVPVWREELRSSSKLLLVERSLAAEFLVDNNLSARQIGLEVGGTTQSGITVTANISNGSGEGAREDAGRTVSDAVNDGKLFSGRVNIPIGAFFAVGLSGALNQAGFQTTTTDTRGNLSSIAPDFGLYLPAGPNGQVEIEGGFAFGQLGKKYTGTPDNRDFRLFDVTGVWRNKLSKVNENLGGMDAYEVAAGLSYVEPDTHVDENEIINVRFGPALYFGKRTRLQVNGEWLIPTANGEETIFATRSQLTFNF